jgi:hypothetical protein
VVTPDGRRLQSRPLAVGYDDGSNSVFIAELQHALGYANGGLTTCVWFYNDNSALPPGVNTAMVSVDITYKVKSGGTVFPQHITGKFNVHRPAVVNTKKTTDLDGTPTPQISPDLTLLEIGNGRINDMSFKHQINPGSFSGQAGYTQLVGDSDDHVHTYALDQTIDRYPYNQLDNEEFQRGTTPISSNPLNLPPETGQGWTKPFYDGPYVNTSIADTYEILHFHTYLLFMPDDGPGPNIYVPLRKIDWTLNDRANTTTLDPSSTAGITSDADWSGFPRWTNAIHNETKKHLSLTW